MNRHCRPSNADIIKHLRLILTSVKSRNMPVKQYHVIFLYYK